MAKLNNKKENSTAQKAKDSSLEKKVAPSVRKEPVVKKAIPKKGSEPVTKAGGKSISKKVPVKSDFKLVVSKAAKESLELYKTSKRDRSFYNKDIIGKLKKIISNYTEHPELLDEIEKSNVADESFIDKLNIDSVDFVEIIVDAEEEFEIKIEDEEVKKLKTFDDMYDMIYTKVYGKAPEIIEITTEKQDKELILISNKKAPPSKSVAKVKEMKPTTAKNTSIKQPKTNLKSKGK